MLSPPDFQILQARWHAPMCGIHVVHTGQGLGQQVWATMHGARAQSGVQDWDLIQHMLDWDFASCSPNQAHKWIQPTNWPCNTNPANEAKRLSTTVLEYTPVTCFNLSLQLGGLGIDFKKVKTQILITTASVTVAKALNIHETTGANSIGEMVPLCTTYNSWLVVPFSGSNPKDLKSSAECEVLFSLSKSGKI